MIVLLQQRQQAEATPTLHREQAALVELEAPGEGLVGVRHPVSCASTVVRFVPHVLKSQVVDSGGRLVGSARTSSAAGRPGG